MKKIIYSLMAFALLGAVSCESMLEIPQKGAVAYETYYASDADAEAAITSMYANYIQNVAGTEGIDNAEQVMLNYAADDIMAAGGNPKDHEPFRYFCEFTYDNANGTLKVAYQNYMFAIYHANLVISNFTNENKAGAEPKWTSDYTEQVVAEARVMRAYLHLMLALSWDRPPIVDRLQEGDDLPTNAESQEQVLQFVIDECQKALDSGKLPKRNGTGDKDATARMSVGFAQFVAGKAAVFMDKMDIARKYLGALINSGDYALIPSEEYWTNFHIAGDGNSETIFEPNFIDDPNYTSNWWGAGAPIIRSRWMVANVFNWGVGKLAGTGVMPSNGVDGWNGGAIQQDFAAKFLAHDGRSPRRLACFLTADEWLYEMDWANSKVNNGTLEEKKLDPERGIKAQDGLFSHGPYFEWKHMVFTNPPAILTGGKEYPSDHVPSLGAQNTNQTNFNVARYAEALLLYAEACIGADEAAGLKALNEVQERSGSGKISTSLTIDAVMEEKQYEMWFENCRFHDLVRWSKKGYVNLDQVFNKSGIHQNVPTVFDEFFIEGKPGYQKEHKLFITTEALNAGFVVGKHEYFPFPHDFMLVNPMLKNVGGWAE
ncbi:MAG: RagB/SusD family nutrient uptake outer membrane protein [Bacteroidales bacterium]|nr:RagB/SusD family nutrient uptake outer membrane protein [Bacteroidales bacterium]